MCKQIFIYDPAKQLAVSALGKYMDMLKAQVSNGLSCCMRRSEEEGKAEHDAQVEEIIQNLQKYPQSDKLVSALMENTAAAFDHLRPDTNLGRNANMVGCRLKETFAWADWNGFTSLESVQQYIEENPGSHLEDGDGAVVPWLDFERLAGASA